MIQGSGTLNQEIAVQINADSRGLQQEASKVEKAFELAARAAQRAFVVFNQVSDSINRLRIRMGQAAAGVFAFGFYQAAQFESAFMDVRKTVDATEAQFKSLGNSLRAMSSTMPTSVAQLSKLAAIAGQLGVAVPSIEKYTKVAAQLGDATEMSAEGAITALAQFMTVTNTAASSVENIASALVQLGNVSNATEQQILNFSQNIAGTASAMGFAATDILAVGTAFSEVGIEAEAGATAVQRVLIDMNMAVSQGGDQLTKYASVLGMTTEQFKAMWAANPSKLLDQFTDSLKAAGSNAPKVLKSLGIDDVRLIRAFTNLANSSADIGTRMEDAAMAAEDNVALAEEAEKRYQSLYSVLQMIKNSFAEIAHMVSGMWLGPVTFVLKQFNGILNMVTSLPGPLKQVLGLMLQMRAVMMMARGVRAGFGLRFPLLDQSLGMMTSQAGRGLFRGIGHQATGRRMETEGRPGMYRGGYGAGRILGAPVGWALGRGPLQQLRAETSTGGFISRGMAQVSSAKSAFGESYRKAQEKFISPEAAEAKEHTGIFNKMLGKLSGIERAIREQTAKAAAPAPGEGIAKSAEKGSEAAFLAGAIDTLGEAQSKTAKEQTEATKRMSDDAKQSSASTTAILGRSARGAERAAEGAANASKMTRVAGVASKAGAALGTLAGGVMGAMPYIMMLTPLVMGVVGGIMDRRAAATEKRINAAGFSQSVESASKEAGVAFTPWSQKQLYKSSATAGPADLATVVGSKQWQDKWRHVIGPAGEIGGTEGKEAYFQEMVMQMTIQKGGNLTSEDLGELYKVIDYVFKGEPNVAYELKMDIGASGLDEAMDIGERVDRVRELFQSSDLGLNPSRGRAAEKLKPAARAAADITAMQLQTGNVLGSVASTAAAYEGTAQAMAGSGAAGASMSGVSVEGAMEDYVRRLQKATESAQGETTLKMSHDFWTGSDSEESFSNFVENVYENADDAGATTNRAIVDALNQAFGGQEQVMKALDEGKITAEELVRISQEQETEQKKIVSDYYKQTQLADELKDINLQTLNLAQRQAVAYGAMVQNMVRGGDLMQNYQSLAAAWRVALAEGNAEAADELKGLMDQAGAMLTRKWSMEISIDFIGKTPAQVAQEIDDLITSVNQQIATEVITPELGQQQLAELDNMYQQQQQAALGQAQQIAGALVNAQRQRAEIERSAAKSRQKAGEQHAKQLKKMQEGLAESYEKIDKEEQKALKKTKENLTSWGSAYERLALKPVSSLKSVVTTMGKQVEKFGEMQANLAKLQGMGLSNPRLLQYLGFDNPENYAQVERFLADAMANPDLIKQLNGEWQDKFDLTQAFTDTSGISDIIREDMDEARKETQESFDKSVKEVNEAYDEQLKEMGEAVADQHRQINLQLTQMAEDMTRTFDQQMALILANPLFKQVGIEIGGLLNQGILLAQTLGGSFATPGTQIGAGGAKTGSGASYTDYYAAMPTQASSDWWDAVWLTNVIKGQNEYLPEGYKPSDKIKNRAIYLHNLGRNPSKKDELAEAGYTSHANTPERAQQLRKWKITNKQMDQGHLAKGGVVTGPTNALIGEAGPEAVIPLNNQGANFIQGLMGSGSGAFGYSLEKTDTGQVAEDFQKELELVMPVLQEFTTDLQTEYDKEHKSFTKKNDENAADLAEHLEDVGEITAKAFTMGIKAGLDTKYLDTWLTETKGKLDELVTKLGKIKTTHIEIGQAYSWWTFLGFKSKEDAEKAGKTMEKAKKEGWFNWGEAAPTGPASSGGGGPVDFGGAMPSLPAPGGGGVGGAGRLQGQPLNTKDSDAYGPDNWKGNAKNTQQLIDFVSKTFGTHASGWANGSGHMKGSAHYRGKAVDIGYPIKDPSFGTKIATYLAQPSVANAFGIKNIIWYNQSNSSGGSGWKGYSGNGQGDSQHVKHVHVTMWDKGGIALGPSLGMVAESGSPEMMIPLDRRGVSFLLDVANQVRTPRQGGHGGDDGVRSTSHVNQFGPVTVVSNDPNEMARRLESKARQRKLTRPAGVSM